MEIKKHNSGIALVMVLGILSVMLILAVAFAIAMRTERMAAGNYADSVRARQLVHVGIARAMADIQNNLCLPDRIVVGRDVNPKITVMGGGTWELKDLVVFETSDTFPDPISINRPYEISYSEGTDVRLRNVMLTTEGKLPDTIAPSETVILDAGSLKTSGMRLYYRGTPIYLTGNDATYYVIPIDQTHIKLANSYDNALQGTAIIPVAGTLNLKPIHYMIPVHRIMSQDRVNKTITLNKKCKFKTGDAVTYYSPAYTTDGAVYYVRVVESDIIQLAESFNKAVFGDCLNVEPFNINGYLKKRGFLAPPWPGFASYTTNASQSIAAKYDLVTFDTALNQVIIGNRYRSGDCITFTKTQNSILPSPLKEKAPYYVINISPNRIELATTIDNALASPPTPIALSGGSGSSRLYLTILSGEVTNYIPMSLYAGVSTAACQAVTNTYVDVTAAVNTNENIFMGKYRYLVANCSGRSDANMIGSATMERLFGTNTEEIAIENLPEIGTTRKAEFLQHRTDYIRYETVRELAALEARPDDLFVYSYSPTEKWNTDMLNYFAPVNLAGDAGELIDRKPAITNAFYMAGIKEEEYREGLYRSLIDYVDVDNIPNNLNGTTLPDLRLPSNEKVPMINEIKFYHKLTTTVKSDATPLAPITTRRYRYEGNIAFEIWWPFVSRPSDGEFTFEYTIVCNPVIISDMSAPGGAVQPVEFSPLIWSGASASGLSLPLYTDGPVIIRPVPIPASINAADLIDKKIDYLQLDYTIKAKVTDTASGSPVDEIDNLTASFRLSPSDVQGDYVEDVRDLECLEPRYNWDIGNDKYWRYIVQSFVNPAGSTFLTLSDETAGRSFSVEDPVSVIGGSLPSTIPPLVAGQICRIGSKANGVITLRNGAGQLITFNSQGKGNNCIKAVLDQYYVDGSDKKLKTARAYPYPPGTTVRVSAVMTEPPSPYTIQTYDPKTRIFTTTPVLPPATYIRDVGDNLTDSLGDVNYWTLSYLDGQTRAGDPYMCVENAQLKSVTELGRLIYSYHPTDPAKIELWTNLTFYGHNTNQLLDVFAVDIENENSDFVTAKKYGLFNPNASNINCLATVLSGA
ncbi:MAG: pilus assembly PilX N-terminal domain-containing protein, partial [Candidatus Gracilibacteria bacterium]|nr:pilus assembly PilX N-terminal domain-containing protein [Candidatus Gracilibacteria bacterium]